MLNVLYITELKNDKNRQTNTYKTHNIGLAENVVF